MEKAYVNQDVDYTASGIMPRSGAKIGSEELVEVQRMASGMLVKLST